MYDYVCSFMVKEFVQWMVIDGDVVGVFVQEYVGGGGFVVVGVVVLCDSYDQIFRI